MEIALNSFLLIVQFALAGFVLYGAYLCLSAWLGELRERRVSVAFAPGAPSSEVSFERVASLVLLALLCTTLAAVA
ncbi:MAG: hypothetical protein ABR570_10180 [Burkholderiales bacterium]